MKTTTIAVLAALALAACNRGPVLETRTFRINHLRQHEIEPLIGPYVYGDRAEAPGTASATDQTLTVRETPDNLDKIARVLEEYDVARPDVRLRFQLIEADGFQGIDPRIAEVEAELRKIFQFQGYRLAGEATVAVTNEASIAQRLAGSDAIYAVEGRVYWVQGGLVHLEDIGLQRESYGEILRTSVNLRPGQTLVLGSSPKPGSTATLLLTVRAEAEADL